MQLNPRVSVVVPCYNYGRFVGDAVGSILAQSFRDFEVIVVDDGSTDDTPDVLRQITDQRVRVLRKPNEGCAAARNTGRALARGEFLAFLDADDLWRPTFLERQLEVLEAEPEVDYCFADLVRSTNGQLLPETQFDIAPAVRELPSRPTAVPGARVLEGDTFAALAPLPDPPRWLQASVLRVRSIAGALSKPGIPNAEDLFLILQIYARARAAFINAPLVELRRHGNNSYRTHDQIRTAVVSVLKQVYSDVELSDHHRDVLRRRIGAEHCRRGWRYFWDRDVRRSAQHYAESLRWPGSRLNALAHLALLPAVPFLPRRGGGFEEEPA
jgi:glycosyltransferase involved in cell wall biosynthesis